MIRSVTHKQLDEFLSDSSNYDIESRIKYFNIKYITFYTHQIIALDNKKIVGILAYQNSYEHNNHLHIEFISIDPEYQNQKISSQLIHEFITIAKDNKNHVAIGSLSNDGRMKALPKIISLCELNNLSLKIKD